MDYEKYITDEMKQDGPYKIFVERHQPILCIFLAGVVYRWNSYKQVFERGDDISTDAYHYGKNIKNLNVNNDPPKGYSFIKNKNMYQARKRVNGKSYSMGLHQTKEEAQNMILACEIILNKNK